MHGRLSGIVPALLLLALAFTGCMGQGPHFENAGVKEVSAKRNADLAASAAKAWDKSAALVAVGGAEAQDAPDPDLPADPDVGNGLATQWTYVYQSAEGKSRAFEVSADGTVVSKNESEAFDDYGSYAGSYAAAYQSYRAQSADGKPLGNWSWDSDAALAAALKNETFRGAARAPNSTLAEALGNTGVPDAWVFMASSPERSVIAAVNATSGEIVGIHDLSRYSWQGSMETQAAVAPPTPPTPPSTPNATAAPPVHLHESGSLTPAQSTDTFRFHLAAPESGRLNVTMVSSGDVLSYGWSLMQGEKVIKTDNSGTFSLSGVNDAMRLALDKPGDYSLVLDMSYVQGAVPLAKVSYDVGLDLVPSN